MEKLNINWQLYILIAVFSLWASMTLAGQSAKETVTDIEKIGKQIYLTGQLPSGQYIQAIVGGDSSVNGDQFSCVSCHRRSRLGTSEGVKQVPPLTATALFKPAQLSVTQGILPKVFKPMGSNRIPYTDETLARAIREGIDPSGRKLDSLMPRYTLDSENAKALIAYLKTENITNISSVNDTTLHFATVVTDRISPRKREVMLDILRGYFQDKNADTRHNTKRAKFSAYKMYQVYRKWALHVWELRGDESTWPAQLEGYYKSQPVLAVVSGLSASSWQPMHDFCEQFEVACILPNTDVPVVSEGSFYTTYFSKGLTLEAASLANHLNNTNTRRRSITQVFRTNGQGQVAAKALSDSLQNSKELPLQNIAIADYQRLEASFWDKLFKDSEAEILVLWLNLNDLETLRNTNLPSKINAVYGSASLIDDPISQLPVDTAKNFYLIYPWELPDARVARLVRVKSWLKSKQIPFEYERLQANTFLSVQVLGEVITHLLDNFSSEYIIERLEGMLGAFSPNSIYPHISLGAGQRFASKGSYIVKVSQDGNISSVGDWIVP